MPWSPETPGEQARGGASLHTLRLVSTSWYLPWRWDGPQVWGLTCSTGVWPVTTPTHVASWDPGQSRRLLSVGVSVLGSGGELAPG